MQIPAWARAIACLMYAAELSGFVIGTWRWRRLGGGQKAITLWFGAAIAIDILSLGLEPILQNTQPLSNVSVLLGSVLALEALSALQTTPVLAGRFRLAAAAYIATWVALHLTVEPLTAYSTYSAPLASIVVLAGAAIVLFQRVTRGRADAFADPAFLIAAGLCGGAVADVFRTLVAELLLHDQPYYALGYYAACNIIVALAELIIIRALLIHRGEPPEAQAETA